MAQYRAMIRGQRGEASRLGSKKSGLTATVNGWDIGCDVFIHFNEEKQRDEIVISLDGGSNGGGSRLDLGRFIRENGEIKKI